MLIETESGRYLINEFAYQMITEYAPQEIPLYVDMRDQYFADPDKYAQPTQAQDEALAFGSIQAVETFSFFVFPIITQILTHIINEAQNALKDEVGNKAVQWVRSLVNSQERPKPIFSHNQLATIEEEIDNIINSESKRLGIRKKQAYAIKNAVITRLALAVES